MNHIAIIHAGAIGDLVQAFPTLRAIRAKWPAAGVTLIGRPARTILARVAGLCDTCIDLDTSGTWRLAPSAAMPDCLQGVDLVVDCLSKPAGSADAPPRPGLRWVRVEPLPPAGWTDTAATWIFREAARALDLPAVPLVPELPVPPALLAAARQVLARERCREPFIAIQPGSGSRRKNWPVERFGELADRLRGETGLPILWLLGPAEIDRGLAPPAGPRDTVLAELPLDQVTGILAVAHLYIGNDSGVTQIAAAVRGPDGQATPTVALFGPTDPRVWAPVGPHVRVVRAADGNMGGITVDDAWASAAEAMTRRVSPP